LLVIAVGIAGLVLSGDAAQQQATQQVQGVVGQEGAAMVKSMMESQTRKGSLIATIVGFVVLLLGASGMFGQLKSSLNLIWHVKPKPGRGILGLVLDRLAALSIVLVIGVLLLASVALSTAVSAFTDQINRFIALPGFVTVLLSILVSLLVVTLLFAMVFKLLPDVTIAWRDVWVGAFFTAVLFLVGEYLLSLYLGRKGTTSAYGAAGSVVLLLMWIYYSSLILFFGAEFTKVRAARRGSRVEPNQHAVAAEEPYLGMLRHKPA
jgi:membrane protein